MPTGRVAVVTGCGSQRGIGFATAAELVSAGWHVAMLDVADEPVQVAKEEIAGRSGERDRVHALACDVTSHATVQTTVASVLERFGRIDALVNNAGITASTRVGDISESEWDAIFAVNVKGVFLTTQAVLPAMRGRRYGRIVNVSSAAGKRGGGIFGSAHYSASKAAVLGFTKAVAREVAAEGITSNAVAPGLIDTDILAGRVSDQRIDDLVADVPLGRRGRADEVAASIAFLCSERAGYITGEEIDVNGGSHMD